MADDLAVCNDALARCGCEAIAALSGDGSTEARTCNRIWPGIKRAMLGSHPWHFATRSQQLTQLAAAAPPPWTKRWQVPAESMLRISAVTDATGENVPFERERGGILTFDVEDPWIHWVADTAVDLWPAQLVEAVTLKLCGALSLALREDPASADRFYSLVTFELNSAKLADSQGRTTRPLGKAQGFRRARAIG